MIVHSPNIELHLKHLDLVMSSLTQAEFAVNAEKCNFCETGISFLGTKSEREDRNYIKLPGPKNQRQLREALGDVIITNL
jgi:hypothetical protein